MHKKVIILASSSPYRKTLLERLKIPFAVESPDIDESFLSHETFEAHVMRLAVEKAQAIAKRYPEAICIGSDTIGTLGTTLLGKPMTHENAVIQLRHMSGQKVTFYTSVSVVIHAKQHVECRCNTIHIYFRELNDRMIENYLQKVQPYFSSASFQSETLGSALIKRFEGNDPTALIGLPLIDLTQMLETVGVTVV